MNRLAIFVAAVVAALACAKAEPPIDSHSDGEQSLTLKVQVVEDGSGAAIRGVRVIYFSKIEAVMRDERAIQRQVGLKTTVDEPIGVSGDTDEGGTAILRCRFDAAFLKASGAVVRTAIYPSGEFVVSKHGYVTREVRAATLFPTPPYSEEALRSLRVVLKKQPNPESSGSAQPETGLVLNKPGKDDAR